MTPPYCIGLTGGIGAGKSAASQRFAELGADIVDADVISSALTAVGGAAVPLISAQFGASFLDAQGGLDRRAMRAHVFFDEARRRQLESILHPLIHLEAARQVALSAAPYVVLAIPLLTENYPKYQNLIDRVLLIDCPESIQLARVLARLGGDIKLAQAMLAAQAGREDRLKIADDVIENDGNLANLWSQVDELHHVYLRTAQRAYEHG